GKKALEAISRERGSFLYGTPTMFVDILNQPDFSSYDVSTMCGGVIAGSPAPPELIRAIINKINMKDLVKSQEEIAAWEDGQQSTDVLLERPGRLLMEPQRTVP
ncbi:ACSF2 isoform 16, partial [Pan troglodytes]